MKIDLDDNIIAHMKNVIKKYNLMTDIEFNESGLSNLANYAVFKVFEQEYMDVTMDEPEE